MSTLNMNGNYAEQMLSMYLWGQLTPPSPSEIANDKWIRPKDITTTVSVDAQSYMATAGSYLSIAHQKMFQLFFNNEYRDEKSKSDKVSLKNILNHGTQVGNEIILNHEQFIEVFYGKHEANIEAKDAQLNLYHYSSGTNSSDYWQRAFLSVLVKYNWTQKAFAMYLI